MEYVFTSKNPSKITHCPKGHPYTAENTRIEKNGKKVARRCVICKNERSKNYELKNRSKALERNKIFRKENPDKISLYDHRSKVKKFGLTSSEYDEMLTAQENRCAICGRHQIEFKHRLSIDHCHKTGRIRGLLCGNCNKALGLFYDNKESLAKALAYLGNVDEELHMQLNGIAYNLTITPV